MTMTREQHLASCKQRALEYLDRGELENAVFSMVGDMQDIEPVKPDLMLVGATAATNRDVAAVRRWIEGFN